MNTFAERLSAWNKNMNDLPRRLLLVLFVVLVCFAAVRLLPYCWPFVLAMLFAALLEPVARLLRRALKRLKAARVIATLLCMILLFGLIITLVIIVGNRVVHEGVNLAKSLPDLVRNNILPLFNSVSSWARELYEDYSHLLPEDFLPTVNKALSELQTNLTSTAGSIATKLGGGTVSTVISTAISLPIILLSIIFTIMGTFYFSYDRERISGFFKNIVPTHVMSHFRIIKTGVFSALFGQVKAQIFISFVLTLIMIAGLYIMGKPYALLLGILIGLADVLPVIGAGLFLNSWAIVAAIMGDYYTAIGLFIIYLVILTVRQIIEPRIVGKQLGLYPLVTMLSMFAGFQLVGTLGLIAGPLVANICRVTLDADAGKLAAPAPALPFSQILAKLRKKPAKGK